MTVESVLTAPVSAYTMVKICARMSQGQAGSYAESRVEYLAEVIYGEARGHRAMSEQTAPAKPSPAESLRGVRSPSEFDGDTHLAPSSSAFSSHTRCHNQHPRQELPSAVPLFNGHNPARSDGPQRPSIEEAGHGVRIGELHGRHPTWYGPIGQGGLLCF